MVVGATRRELARHGQAVVVAQPLRFLGPCTSEGADGTAVAVVAAAVVAVSLYQFRIGCVEGGRRFLEFCVCVTVGDLVDNRSRLFKFGDCVTVGDFVNDGGRFRYCFRWLGQ